MPTSDLVLQWRPQTETDEFPHLHHWLCRDKHACYRAEVRRKTAVERTEGLIVRFLANVTWELLLAIAALVVLVGLIVGEV